MRDKLEELLASSQRICLLGHTRPDGDCLGFYSGLEELFKESLSGEGSTGLFDGGP